MNMKMEFENSLRPGEALDRYKITLWYKSVGLLETREILFGKFNDINSIMGGIEIDIIMYNQLQERQSR